MPEINRCQFKYDPVHGELYYDAFRRMFHTERPEDIKETLQFICRVNNVVREIEGEIRFSAAEDEPPIIRSLRRSAQSDRAKYDDPFPTGSVELWPK